LNVTKPVFFFVVPEKQEKNPAIGKDANSISLVYIFAFRSTDKILTKHPSAFMLEKNHDQN
jgi:hypothetical protein